MHTFDAQTTRERLPFEQLIPALQRLFASGCDAPARQVLSLDGADGAGVTSLIMPAWVRGRFYGIKTVNVAPGNAARGLPGLHAVYLLFNATTGVPLALMDGNEITQRRTAAASALAASWLARPQASHLLVVGAGQVAQCLPWAYRVVRPITQVSLWARDAAQGERLVAQWRAQGLDATRVDDLPQAVAQADIISCATLAREPVVQGAWLSPGSHLDLIGSFTPQMREADDAALAGAGLYIDTDEALHKSGDLLGPIERGVVDPRSVRGTLAQLCRGEVAGRRSDTERTVFKSVGTALEDLAAAMLVIGEAVRA